MTDVEEEIIEEIVDDELEPRPGLIILDMSVDQMKGVSYQSSQVVENCVQLAKSDFFHVCLDAKPKAPKFRGGAGAQLVDGLKELSHLNPVGKASADVSALSDTNVLETLQSMEITHVCLCGQSTETSVYATAKDLVDQGLEVFVVSDAITSKSGSSGHSSGLDKIRGELGDHVVVEIAELLGEDEVYEEVVEDEDGEEWVEEVVDDEYEVEEEVIDNDPGSTPSTSTSARGPAPYLKEKSGNGGLSPEAKAARDKTEELRLSDAARLAAHKKEFDNNRFAHINKTNAVVDGQRAKTGGAPVNSGKTIKKGPSTTVTSDSSPALGGKVPKANGKAAKTKAAPKKKGWGIFGRGKKGPVAAPESTTKVTETAPVSKHAFSSPEHAPAAAAEDKSGKPKTWKGQGEKMGTHTPAGAKPNTTGAKTMVVGNSIQDKIAGLQGGGMRTTNAPQRRMKTPKVVTDVKETWDKQGNITREITRYITEIDGTKRTEKSTEYVPAKK